MGSGFIMSLQYAYYIQRRKNAVFSLSFALAPSRAQVEVSKRQLAERELVRGQRRPASRVRALRVGGPRVTVDAGARILRQTETFQPRKRSLKGVRNVFSLQTNHTTNNFSMRSNLLLINFFLVCLAIIHSYPWFCENETPKMVMM